MTCKSTLPDHWKLVNCAKCKVPLSGLSMRGALEAMTESGREAYPVTPTGQIGDKFFCHRCYCTVEKDYFNLPGPRLRLKTRPRKENPKKHRGPRIGPRTRPTHCRMGHEFTPENTYTYDGLRSCKICISDRRKADYAKKKKKAEPPLDEKISAEYHSGVDDSLTASQGS